MEPEPEIGSTLAVIPREAVPIPFTNALGEPVEVVWYDNHGSQRPMYMLAKAGTDGARRTQAVDAGDGAWAARTGTSVRLLVSATTLAKRGHFVVGADACERNGFVGPEIVCCCVGSFANGANRLRKPRCRQHCLTVAKWRKRRSAARRLRQALGNASVRNRRDAQGRKKCSFGGSVRESDAQKQARFAQSPLQYGADMRRGWT